MNKYIYNDETTEVIWHFFNHRLNIDPFFHQDILKREFAFLCNPDDYNEGRKFTLSNVTIYPINKNYQKQFKENITKNIFWNKYMNIGLSPEDRYTSWDRQEPYQYTLPYQSFEIEPGVRLNVHSTVFLFPCGFSNILTFRIKGPLMFNKLEDICFKLYNDKIFKINKDSLIDLDTLITKLKGDVMNLIYSDSASKKLGKVEMSKLIITRSNDSRNKYLDEDKKIIINSIYGRNMETNLDNFSKISNRCESVEINKKGVTIGYYTGFYSSNSFFIGGFLDIQKYDMECLAMNLRNHAIMVDILGYFIDNKSRYDLSKSPNYERLIETSKEVLYQLDGEYGYGHRVARHYRDNHPKVKNILAARKA